MTAADIFVAELQSRGVPFVASLNGHGLDPFYLACQRANMRVIDVRNEQAASYMAEVTGRLSRTVGVCAVSGAVAHANALTGVVNAWFDGAPMLLITGMIPLAELGWGNFQDFNPVPMAAPVCKYARLVDDPHRIGQIVHEAFAAATSGRPGPVHLALPMDVAAAKVDPARVVRSPVQSGVGQTGGAADPDQIETAVEMLNRAARPLLVAGSGLYYARGEAQLARFANQQQIPTVVPIWDRGTVSEPLGPFMGVIGAASGGPRLLADADLIIMAGAEFDYRIGQFTPPAIADDLQVIRIHADASRLRQGLEAHLSILGSPAKVLDQLASACVQSSCRPAESWFAEAKQRRAEYREACLEVATNLPDGINGKDIVLTIHEHLTDQTIVLVDGGNIGQWFHQLLTDRYPGHWVTCGASGVVGWGLPGAMAARALDSKRPVILLSGDGSFTFTTAELECASRQGLAFVVIVADDEQWGISVTGHLRQYQRPLYSMLGPTRFELVAKGFGCHGVRVEQLDQLGPALAAALEADRPTVIHVPVVPSSPGK